VQGAYPKRRGPAWHRGSPRTPGLGSGRWKDRARKTLESYRMLDVNQLSEMGCLQPGWFSTCQWTDGSEVFSIRLRAQAERLHLRYKVRVGGGGWENMAETIPIVHLHCRFGGSRPFFICPGPGFGTDCGRRVAKLHFSSRYFLCRHCLRLAYSSQYEQPWKRALRRVNKKRRRLGISAGIAKPLPEKPKGMWTRTYGRLLDEILQAEILAHEGQANMLKRLTQIKTDLE
jgi:hypothetical protein